MLRRFLKRLLSFFGHQVLFNKRSHLFLFGLLSPMILRPIPLQLPLAKQRILLYGMIQPIYFPLQDYPHLYYKGIQNSPNVYPGFHAKGLYLPHRQKNKRKTMVRFVTGYPKDKRDISTALRKNNTSSYTNFIRYGRHITRKPKSTFEILKELVIIQF